jgi:hypothetical protein
VAELMITTGRAGALAALRQMYPPRRCPSIASIVNISGAAA